MKNKIILISILLISLSCKAQYIIPVEEAVNYKDSIGGLIGDKSYIYVKDVNNLLNKFVGTWKGTFNNKHYEFVVMKTTNNRNYSTGEKIKIDLLLMRHKITDNQGNVIENTTTLPNKNTSVMEGDYLSKTGSYVFYYQGNDAACGQFGSVFISVFNSNYSEMELFLSVGNDTQPSNLNCPNVVVQIIPTEKIILTKQ